MPKTEKIEKVAVLKERIDASEALLLADYRGLTVNDVAEFREMLLAADAKFAVVKNTLMKRAAEDAGVGDIASMLEGPTAVAFVKGDAVLAAKKMAEAAKKFPAIVVKGGYMEGRVLSEDEAKQLAKLESREGMLAQIAGLAKGQMSKAAYMFQAMQSQFLAVADALKDKRAAEEAAAVVPEPEPEPELGPEPAEAPAEPEVPESQETPAEPAAEEAPTESADATPGESGEESPTENEEEGKE